MTPVIMLEDGGKDLLTQGEKEEGMTAGTGLTKRLVASW